MNTLSDSELLALAAVGGRAPTEAERFRQAEVIARFSDTEGLPSVELVSRKKWARWQAARENTKTVRLTVGAA